MADPAKGEGPRKHETSTVGAYGEEFVAFDEMDDTRPASDNLWNPVTNLFEVAVFRHHGPPLVVKNLPPRTADLLRKAMTDALRERRS